MESPVQRFKILANQLQFDTLDLLDQLYTEDIHFVDPIADERGLKAVREYYARLYEGVKSIEFSFEGEVVEDTGAVLFWTMHMEHKRFRKGEMVHLPGCSHLQFGEKIHFHRDYYDMGALLYERIPLLGGIIRSIKSRL